MSTHRLFSINHPVGCSVFITSWLLIGWWANNMLLFLAISLAVLLIGLLYQIHQHFNTATNQKVLLNAPPAMHNRANFLKNQTLEELVFLLRRGIWQQRKKTKHYSSELREQYRMLNKLPYGLVVVNAEGIIEWNNRYARKLLGLKKTDCFSLITMFVRAPAFVKFIEVNNYKTPCIFSLTGTEQTVVEVVRYDYGGAKDILLFRNITQEEQQQQTHKRFLANASHEMQNPLTIIRGNAELAVKTSKSKQQQTQLNEIINQVDSMSALMQSLMTLARVDESTTPESPKWINPQYTMRLACQMAQRELANQQEITFEMLPNRELWINQNDLFIIVRNLVSNAIKYGASDKPIQLNWYIGKLNQYKNNKKYAIIEVRDFGTGIHKDQINKIGKRFIQLAPQPNSNNHGLGLSIVKGLLKLYSGRLIIKSTPNQGSSFYCVFRSKKYSRKSLQQPAKTVITP